MLCLGVMGCGGGDGGKQSASSGSEVYCRI